MAARCAKTGLIGLLLLAGVVSAGAQTSENDTIRLSAVVENGITYPMVLLPEFETIGQIIDPEAKKKKDRLRNDIFVAYPYAITAATIFKEINGNLDKLDKRHDRKKYLKSVDKMLDNTFKEPLKNLSIDQGHVLIKLVNRQTGQDCYSIIKELKGGINAMVWQGVGVFFNNNLRRDYDPEGDDLEMEKLVRELEASNLYRYQLYQQEALLKKITKSK